MSNKMPPTRESSTTSYFQPTDKGKSKETHKADMAETSSSSKPPEDTQAASNNKRPLSPSFSSTSDRPTKVMATSPSHPPTTKTLQITHHTGDIFSAPPDTLLIHACNTRGVWGAGIAKAFKISYPAAHTVHKDYCTKTPFIKSNPVPTGTAQLIVPQNKDGQGHWIGCLFTSAGYGKKKDSAEEILGNTRSAVEGLLEQLKEAKGEIGEVRMCRINSGRFGVEWEKTEEVLRSVVIKEGWMGKVGVWMPE
jgi:ADP-ribose 1''-phosphate phosphatase